MNSIMKVLTGIVATILLATPNVEAQPIQYQSGCGSCGSHSASFQPIWTIYTPAHALPCFKRMTYSQGSMLPPLPNTGRYRIQRPTPLNIPTESLAPGTNTFVFENETAAQSVKEIPNEVVNEPLLIEETPSEDASRGDNLDSPSDIVLETDTTARMQAEMDRLKQIIVELENSNKSYGQKVADLETMLADKSKHETDSASAEKNRRQQMQEEMKRIKQDSARAIAKARKETEKAKADLMKTRKRLAASAKKEKSVAKGKEKKADKDPNKKTLAKIAEEKRQQRQSQAKQQSTTDKDTSDKGTSNGQMQNQIERAVSKIKRRFIAKIERIRKENGSDEDIKKLESEMKVQIEKMQERIQNRFKNRK